MNLLNTLKITFFLALISGIFLGIGYFIGGQTGLIISFALATIMNVGSYWYSDKLVLQMHDAKPINRESDPELFAMVQSLASKAQIPMPKLYRYQSPQPNAFATGRNPENGIVAVSTGLLNVLNQDEVEGVLAHEIAHINNRDMLISTIAATFGTAISYLGNFFFFLPGGSSDEDGTNPIAGIAMAILAPIAAIMIQMLISRSREYTADATGARLTGNPMGLANALLKIEAFYKQGPKFQPAYQQSAVAHMYISNPFTPLGQLFSTHPPTTKRVEKLKQM